MAVEMPEFITIDFFQKIFEKNVYMAKGKELRVDNFWGEFATNPGDNYASEMYRITVDYEVEGKKNRTTLILKIMPAGEIQEQVMVKNKLYPREIHTYNKLLVEVDKLLVSIGDNTKFAPCCFYTATEPKMMLMFEDMRDRNYKVLPRAHQLSFDEALPLVVKLAKLHAASVVVYDRHPSIMEPYIEGSISTNPDRQDFLVHYRNCARTLGEVADNEWGEEWKEIAGKLKALKSTIVEKACETVYARDAMTFSVFNHNDLWVPNIFYKINDDKVEDLLLIDFQMPFWGSPGVDLNFLFYGALREDVRISSSNKLIRKYHETLKSVLESLKYEKKIPTLHEIHVEYLKTGFNSVLASLAEVPLLMMDDSDEINMDLLLGSSAKSEKFRYTLFNNPKYKSFIQKVLIEFNDIGYLD